MTVFLVPDDFPLVSLAVASPLVQKGDVILVKKGVESEVVVVPPEKRGLRIVGDQADGFVPDEEPVEAPEDTEAGEDAENEVGDMDPPGPDETGVTDPDQPETPEEPNPEQGDTEETAVEQADPAGSAEGDQAVEEEPDLVAARQPFIMITRAGGKMVRVGQQGAGSPYWAIVHRSR